MSGAFRDNALERLVGAMCDGTITADDTGQLNALLTGDDEARRFYNNYMFLHAELYSQHASLEAVESGGDFGLERAGSSLTPGEVMKTASQPMPLSRKLFAWLAVAAALLGVAAVSSWVTYALTSRLAAIVPDVA